MEIIIGLKELRQNVDKFAKRTAKGDSFVVMRKNKPLLKLTPVEDESEWETVVDFTQIHPKGAPLEKVIAALEELV